MGGGTLSGHTLWLPKGGHKGRPYDAGRFTVGGEAEHDSRILQKHQEHGKGHQPEVRQAADQNDADGEGFALGAPALSDISGGNPGLQVYHFAALSGGGE
jgi:hypothetical protein